MTRRSSFNRFWEDIIRAGILTAIAGFIVFIGISGCGYYGNKKDYSQESFRYKQVLFLSAAGKTIGLNELDAYDIKTDNQWAGYIGKYIREEHKRGKSLENILKNYLSIRVLFDNIGSGSDKKPQRDLLAQVLRSKNVTWEAMSMAQDWRFHELADNPEDIKALDTVLSSKDGKIPTLIRKEVYTPWGMLILIWIVAIQSISYFTAICNNNIPSISDLSWNRPGVYLTILILSPGALPLMALYPGLTGLLGAVSVSWKGSNRKKLDLRTLAANPAVSSGELLDRLNKRLGNKGTGNE